MTDNKTRPTIPKVDNKTIMVIGCHYNSCGFCGYKNVCYMYKQLDNIKANADYQIEGRDIKIDELEEKNSQMFNTIALQEQQREKMKCCEICNHNRGGCSYHHNWTKECLENKHKYLELKE